MSRTLCTLILACIAVAVSACSPGAEQIKKPPEEPRMEEHELLETIIIDNEYVKKNDRLQAERHFRRGEVYFRMDMFDEAFEEYWSAYELDKKTTYMDGLGIASIKLKRLGDARYFLEESCKKNPRRIEPFANLAFVDMLEGKFDAAEKKYKTLIKKVPNNIVINYNLGQAILVSVLVELKDKMDDSEGHKKIDEIDLDRNQVQRLREARRYLANVSSLPAVRGRYAAGSEIEECKKSSKEIVGKIDHALAKYPR